MKTLLLCLSALLSTLLFTGGVLNAQTLDIAGAWQGTLQVGPQQLRIVIKLTRGDGNLSAVLYSIDQTPAPIPTSGVTLQGSTLKFAVPAIAGTYEGRIAAEGTSIAGAWTQNDIKMPLNLARATPDIAWTIPEPPPPPKPMPANAIIHVEVATVKPSSLNAPGRLYTLRGEQVLAINTSVMNLITFAYDVHERQVAGLQNWASDDKFEIAVKPDTPGQPNINQMKKLFQEVLTDRFQLKFHTEKRELPVYAITLPAGTQHKLTKSAAQGSLPALAYPRLGLLPARNATMRELAESMQTAVLDRPVIDRTGIEGRYDFTLDWMPDETQFASFGRLPQTPDNGKPNIFNAYQEQLGLKLEGVRAPSDIMVIDKVEKPGEN